MTAKNIFSLITSVLMFITLIMTTSCLPLSEKIAAPVNNRALKVVVSRQYVDFDIWHSSDQTATRERQKLLGFLDQATRSDTSRYYLKPMSNSITLDDIAIVTDRLIENGIPSSRLQTGSAGISFDYDMRLIVENYSVNSYGCPNWSSSNLMLSGSGTSSNFGCSATSNLAASVWNKRDLINSQNRTTDPTVNTIQLKDK